MAKKSEKREPEEAARYVVTIRHQLYIESPATGAVIAGSRLLKGDLPTRACPAIEFNSTSPEEAEKNRKLLEDYVNAWEALHAGRNKIGSK